jgi:hypothetical protein
MWILIPVFPLVLVGAAVVVIVVAVDHSGKAKTQSSWNHFLAQHHCVAIRKTPVQKEGAPPSVDKSPAKYRCDDGKIYTRNAGTNR